MGVPAKVVDAQYASRSATLLELARHWNNRATAWAVVRQAIVAFAASIAAYALC